MTHHAALAYHPFASAPPASLISQPDGGRRFRWLTRSAAVGSPCWWGLMTSSAFGPFFFQTSRILHYLVCFLIGAGIGASGMERGLPAPDGKLARRWPVWAVAALVAFGSATTVPIAAPTAPGSQYLWETIGGFCFTLSCTASSIAFLVPFVRFLTTPHRIFESLKICFVGQPTSSG
jgi:hypothetical protein